MAITSDLTNYGTISINSSTFNSTISMAKAPVRIADNGIEMDDGCDIKLNGRSLSEFMKYVEERLNILVPNRELEAEWEELRELGEKYRALEAELLAKSKVWETLKK